mmetsp:Transcript_18782/g.26482  ORF Transcript_18782/g.26482 Transcript_18782/m.26482 type:complete len:440 (+) Transcript_18782:85-1404(+)
MKLISPIILLLLSSLANADRRVRGRRKRLNRVLETYSYSQSVVVHGIQNVNAIDQAALKAKFNDAAISPDNQVDHDVIEDEGNQEKEDIMEDFLEMPDNSNLNYDSFSFNIQPTTRMGKKGGKKEGKKESKSLKSEGSGKKGSKSLKEEGSQKEKSKDTKGEGSGKKKATYKSTVVRSDKKGKKGGDKGGKKHDSNKSKEIESRPAQTHPPTQAPHTPSPTQEPTAAPISSQTDFSFVDFGSYEMLEMNKDCGSFFYFSADPAFNEIESLSNGTENFTFVDFSSSNESVWYGYGIESFIVGRNPVVYIGGESLDEIDIVGIVAAAFPSNEEEASFNPGASEEAKVYYFEADDHRIVSWENLPIESLNVVVNAQILFYYNGDIEVRWGEAFGTENDTLSAFFVSSSFYQSEVLAYQEFGGSTMNDWPTNQCSRFILVKPE